MITALVMLYRISILLSFSSRKPLRALSLLYILITIEHGIYSTTLYDKRDSFNFNIVNMGSNVPSKPAYGIYISHLVRIGRVCSIYHQFCEQH